MSPAGVGPATYRAFPSTPVTNVILEALQGKLSEIRGVTFSHEIDREK